ncbi:MAG: NUDIX domain-containing protein [Bacteroidia bacterium]|nr:NUDIX domain-containing protein [Bacteroidia bacterium]MDW8345894.1 NUDIX domain-containing protein [Bacteroidia bacterium]
MRVRVCGIHIQDKKILLVKHRALQEEGFFWAPPGGGLQFGETLSEALKREFLEETGLIVTVSSLIAVTEYIQLPLHAIELFYQVIVVDGRLIQGKDPEISEDNQIISGVKMLSLSEIQQLKQENYVKHTFHSILDNVQVLELLM